jgi:phosphoribosylpyrophosphate synthetase
MRRLGIQLTPTQCTKFADQESGVRIQEAVRAEDVFILQSPAPPSVSPLPARPKLLER